jgi:signal transduction histidine kinase
MREPCDHTIEHPQVPCTFGMHEQIGGMWEAVMTAPGQPSSPWPDLTQLLQRVGALEVQMARQHTTFTAVRDNQEALSQMVADLRQVLTEGQHVDRDTQRNSPLVPLEHLAAGLAHDLRNPLGAIFLNVELLEEEWHQPSANSAAQVAESLNDIKTHLMRLDDRVQDYLLLLRLERLERTPHELGAVVQAWAAQWQVMAQARGGKLEVDGLEPVGTVALHPSTLHRAVRHLVLNALEAMPQGGTVMLVRQSSATQVQLQVHDGDVASRPSNWLGFLTPCIPLSLGELGWDCTWCSRSLPPMRDKLRCRVPRVRAPQ